MRLCFSLDIVKEDLLPFEDRFYRCESIENTLKIMMNIDFINDSISLVFQEYFCTN